ncbi:PucR family transcriptional regulator [Cohnella sp. 56]|uniref:PucR family transcriptional regulator n=1 Tax=Cohnella sp. 56 TaxID=3113722 RepID=UPI0030EB0699
MRLEQAMLLNTLSAARVVAGAAGLDRTVRWVHVVDLPDPLPWVREGELVLTTGYAWPRKAEAQRELVAALAGIGLAGIGFGVPGSIKRIPDATREAAEAQGLPLLEIPWEVPFSSVTQELLGAIVASQYETIVQSEEIHRQLMGAALEADSLQDIVALLGRLIGRAVRFERADGVVLASWVERTESVAHTDADTGRAAYADRWTSYPVYVKKERIGALAVADAGAPPTELERRAAEFATLVAALHLSGQRQLASLESQLGVSFLYALQEGAFEPTPQTIERAKLLGFDPRHECCVVLAVLDVPVPLSPDDIVRRERLAERLKSRLKGLGAPQLVSYAQEQLSYLAPDEATARRLCESFGAPGASFAVSRPHTGFGGVSQGYAEVRAMLPHLEKGRCFTYDELLLPRLLAGEREARAPFLQSLFRPFAAVRNGRLFVDTLAETARCGYQLRRAAERLSIHPKTLRYRLDRAAEIGGFDLADEETRFNLQLAARILSPEDKFD